LTVKPQANGTPGSYEKLTNNLDGSRATTIDRFGNSYKTETYTVTAYENGKPTNGKAKIVVTTLQRPETLRDYVKEHFPDTGESGDSYDIDTPLPLPPDHDAKACKLCIMSKKATRKAVRRAAKSGASQLVGQDGLQQAH